MIKKLLFPYEYSDEELNCISTDPNNWDSRRSCIKTLKSSMNNHFDIKQNEKCCYCGLYYDRTGRGEIDHIAPKGDSKYPQFTFHNNNLAKACQLCNSSTMKHMYDTIQIYNDVYENCEFKIVHPYLDNHTEHYSWRYNLRGVTISINNDSEKARESIRIFQLDSVKRTRARAQQKNQEKLELLFNLSDQIKNKIKDAIKFKI